MQIYEMKSVTRKHCSLGYTFRRNCSSTTKMKPPHNKMDEPQKIHTINLKPVTESRPT